MADDPQPMIELDTEELRAPILRSLCIVTIILAWAWIAIVAPPSDYPPKLGLVASPLLLFAFSAICLLAQGCPLTLRSAFFLLGISSALIVGNAYRFSPIWLFYQSLTVGVAGLLMGPGSALALALLVTMGALSIPGSGAPVGYRGMLGASLGLLWATAVVSWLSSRNLYMALSWALDSQARAWQTAEEVRNRRGELRRTLDSLRTTYGLLERTMRELRVARREAEDARRVKSRFVANISHELRTPLNIIVGFAEMLCTLPEAYGATSWSPMLREDLLIIRRNAQHLLSMIDDVLDLAQIEADRMPIVPEPTDLDQLVRDTLVTAATLLRDTKLELRVTLRTPGLTLDLDATRVRQVLLNLINNAARFTQEGYVEVGTYVAGQEAIVYVRDTGSGIPQDKLEAVFREFEQADTSIRRPHQGTGLGLAICRHFVRLHGGRMWVESTLGEGSVFYFSLPAGDGHASLPPVGYRSTQPAGPSFSEVRRSVAVVCRDPVVLRLLERHLDGLHLLPVESVGDAIPLVRDEHPEMVVVVVESPRSWNDAVRDARSLAESMAPLEMPIVVCGFPTERGAATMLGATEFLTKPVTRDAIISTIERLCDEPRCILIVDDDPDMARFLARTAMYTWQQCRIMTASTGSEAIALLGQQPDVVLLDLLMPDMNGAHVAAAMRSQPTTMDTPIVVITARAPEDDMAAMAIGEMHVVRSRGFSAMEVVRSLEALRQSLPPHYAVDSADQRDIPGVVMG